MAWFSEAVAAKFAWMSNCLNWFSGWCYNNDLLSITSLSHGELLIFYTLGGGLVAFGVQAKLTYITSGASDDRKMRNECASLYGFVQQINSLAGLYLIAGCLLLWSSWVDEGQNWRTFLFNVSFGIAVVVSWALFLIYLRMVIRPRVRVFLIFDSDYCNDEGGEKSVLGEH